MRLLMLSVMMLALAGFLMGCAAGGETSVEEVEETEASVEEVASEESTETPSETTIPSPAISSEAAQSEGINASPEKVEAVREQDQAQGGQGISVNQTADPDPATVGHPLTFTISVTNRSVPQRIGFKDFLPPSMTLISVTPNQGTCGMGHHDGNEVGCTLGVVPSGESATIEVVAIPTVPGTVTNTAVGLAEFTPATSANTNTANITVNPAS
jgi:uncharacterized repeat protein (TIGR01451 family)